MARDASTAAASGNDPFKTGLFKTGWIVEDLDAAMRDIGGWLGLSWTPVQEAPLALRTSSGREDVQLRFAYSTGTPPYIELIESHEAGYYAAPQGAHLHHVGRWVDDVAAASQELVRAGLPLEAAGIAPDGSEPALFAFHAGPHGTRIEIVDRANRENFEAWLAGGELVF